MNTAATAFASGASRRKKFVAGRQPLILSLIVLVPIAFAGPNLWLALYACAVLCLGFRLFWREDEPLILLFIFLYQWLQAGAGPFYGNLMGLTLYDISEYPGQHDKAVFLELTGVAVLAVAIRMAAGPPRDGLMAGIRNYVLAYAPRAWLMLHVIVWIACAILTWMAGNWEEFSQPLLALAQCKWATFFLFTLSTFSSPERPKLPWILALLVELSLTTGGFFADFTSPFFFSLLGLLSSGRGFLSRNKLVIATLVLAMVAFAVVWSSIKKEYREFLNNDSGEQVVEVDYSERMAELRRQALDIDEESLNGGIDRLARRIQYYQFFGVALDRVPYARPYSEGNIWLQGVTATVMPRFIFKDKEIVDDTSLTSYYTGISPASWTRGVSVSMGYMTEAYIDFGQYFMFTLIAGLGLAIGAFYRWLLSQPGLQLLLGSCLAPVALMPFHLLETSIIKLIPTFALSFLTCFFVLKIIGPWLLEFRGVAAQPENLGPTLQSGPRF